jgi:outer membrane protein TolC
MANSIMRHYAKPVAASVLALALAGCAVGPDFKDPAAPDTPGYTKALLPSQVGSADAGGAQTLAMDRDIPAQWWTLFHSPTLNELVEAALKQNPNIDAARAALRQAHELSDAQRGSFFPTVSADVNPTRQKTAGLLAPIVSSNQSIYSLQTVGLSVGFTPDIWGANRRQVESLDAQSESEVFQLEAAKLTLASNVVVAAIQEASLRAQIESTHRLIESQRDGARLL